MRSRCLSLCTVWLLHSQWPSEQIWDSESMRLPILPLLYRLFWQNIASTRSIIPLQHRFGSLRLLAVPKTKISVESEICECHGHAVHKVSQRCLTADWLAPRESDCSWMHSKVSSDWLPSYIKATPPVLEIFKMASYSYRIFLSYSLWPVFRLLFHVRTSYYFSICSSP